MSPEEKAVLIAQTDQLENIYKRLTSPGTRAVDAHLSEAALRILLPTAIALRRRAIAEADMPVIKLQPKE